eukprot:6183345-Pleurochrysis_carterae.AAC.1
MSSPPFPYTLRSAPSRDVSRIKNADIMSGTDMIRQDGADSSRFNPLTTILHADLIRKKHL